MSKPHEKDSNQEFRDLAAEHVHRGHYLSGRSAGHHRKRHRPCAAPETREVQFFDIGTKDYMAVRGQTIRQRDAFVAAIQAKQADTTCVEAFRFVVGKVAYTWFNRLIAIRFMEINDYLPGRVRVLSSENASRAEPDMVTWPFDTVLSFNAQEQDEIMRMKNENRQDEFSGYCLSAPVKS